jgi:hypothetical protein
MMMRGTRHAKVAASGLLTMESSSWKGPVLRAVGFGTGLAAGLILLSASVYWLTQRPRTWTTAAITAGQPELSMVTGEVITFKVRYPLTNHTKVNYTLPESPAGALFFNWNRESIASISIFVA